MKDTTTYSSTQSQTTDYVYDSKGNVVLSYVPKTWSKSDGSTVTGWTASITQDDLTGRTTDSYSATYIDGGDGILHFTVTPTSTSTGVVAISNSIYNDATQTTSGGSVLHPGHTDYNAAGQVADTVDQYGRQTVSTYDVNGRTIRTVNPDGTETRTVYDVVGRVTWQTDTFLPANSDLISTANVANVTHTLYDSLGRAYMTERYTNIAITIVADIDGFTKAVAPTGFSQSSSQFLSYSQSWFDDQGRTIETRDASGLRSGTIYYPNGQAQYTGILTTSAPDGGHSGVFTTSDFASKTQYLYDQIDGGGNRYDRVVDANGHHTDSFKDKLGRVVKTIYDDGSFTQTVYSVGDQAIGGYYVSGTTLPTIPAGGSETVQLAQRKSGDPAVATIDVSNPGGNLVDVYSPAVADTLNGGTMTRPHTHYDYNASGNEIEQSDADGHHTFFAYDENGNEVSRTLPVGEKERFTYNVFGQQATHTDFDGNIATEHYDSQGRLSEVDYTGASTETVTYHYDALGRQSEVDDSVSGNVTYQYDAQGNVIKVTSPQGVVNHTYNSATGQLIRTWTDDGAVDQSFAYDGSGRLATVTVTKLNGSTVNQITTYSYDLAGNLQTTVTNTGSVTLTATYGYNDLNQLTSLVNTSGGTTLSSYTYQYDSAGRKIHATEVGVDGVGVTRTIAYAYDADGRLTTETDTVGSTTTTTSYTFDLVGNRITQTSGGTTTTSSYNADDQLISQSGGVTYDYDANGSTLDKKVNGSVVASYTWDVRNRMHIATISGVTETYTYDDAGNRVSVVNSSTGTASYEFDTANPTGYPQVLAETSGSTTTAYAYGLQRIGITTGSTTHVYVYDGHGSVRQLTSNAGIITDRYTYDSYGNLLLSAATTFNPYRYSSMRLDFSSGLYDDNARYYKADAGGFFSGDGQGYGSNANPISRHRYLYTNGDPIDGYDPSGHDDLLFSTLWAANFGLLLDIGGSSLARGYGKALGINTDVYNLTGTLVDPYGPLATSVAWLEGFGQGAAQGFLNAINGVTDAFIGLVNLAIEANPASNIAGSLGIDLSIPAPDWSQGKIYNEASFEHSASKFLGGEGIITLATVGVGAVLTETGDIHHVATVRHADWTPVFRQLFDDAGVSMENMANKVRVARHIGPHPELYHTLVYNELQTATAGKTGASLTEALLNKVGELARRCATPGDPLNYLITRP